MEKNKNGRCIYNLEVLCKYPHCENCGWNPKVSQERIKHIFHRFRVERKKVEE